MPIYEFRCDRCRHEFETFVPRVGAEAPCPACGSEDVTRSISCPAAPPSSSAASSPSGGGCAPGG